MNYKKIHQNISKNVQRIMPSHLARLNWSREHIEEFQLEKLKLLLAHAKKHSPYYRAILKPYDIQSMQISDLQTLPTLNKATLLEHWDDIVCIPEITKAKAEAHLQLLRDNLKANPFFQNQYYITASGGSSGLRGLYAWDSDYFANITAVDFRYQIRDEIQNKNFTPRITAVLTAPSPIHASTPLCTTRLAVDDKIIHLPVDASLHDLSQELNQIQPTHLIGYASVISRLAREAQCGALHISPKRVTTNSEPLNHRARESIQKAWNILPNNTWGSVEMGIAGIEDDHHQGLILSEDMIIFEPQDKQLVITNLFNQTLPLIRYVVDDIVHIKTSPISAYHITPDIAGRNDDWFVYPNQVEIHPMIFWDVLEREVLMSEYQVEQTKQGANIRIIASEGLQLNHIQKKLEYSLKKSGLDHPVIVIKRVENISRHQETGKLRRFLPLPPTL
jgi:phenylacetate-coenzyme A ligase PaaK-like adenylate-forming protein